MAEHETAARWDRLRQPLRLPSWRRRSSCSAGSRSRVRCTPSRSSAPTCCSVSSRGRGARHPRLHRRGGGAAHLPGVVAAKNYPPGDRRAHPDADGRRPGLAAVDRPDAKGNSRATVAVVARRMRPARGRDPGTLRPGAEGSAAGLPRRSDALDRGNDSPPPRTQPKNIVWLTRGIRRI